MTLFADRSFEEVSKSLELSLENIADGYFSDKNADLFEMASTDKKISIDDEFGPMTPFNAVEKTFRAALVHVDLAGKSRKDGNLEVAWARLAWASQLIGRIQRVEEIEAAAVKQRELTYDLKIKTIELVSCLRPEGGWETHEAAYKAIEPELNEYRKGLSDDEKKKNKEADLIEQLQRWRKGDPLVRAAFAGNSAKNKAERAKKMGK